MSRYITILATFCATFLISSVACERTRSIECPKNAINFTSINLPASIIDLELDGTMQTDLSYLSVTLSTDDVGIVSSKFTTILFTLTEHDNPAAIIAKSTHELKWEKRGDIHISKTRRTFSERKQFTNEINKFGDYDLHISLSDQKVTIDAKSPLTVCFRLRKFD